MKVDETGWKWIKEDCRGLQVVENGWKWMKVDNRRWM